MDIDQQASIARALRAYIGIEQRQAAAESGVNERTLRAIERGENRAGESMRTLLAYYASKGLSVAIGEGDSGPIVIVARS